MRTNKENKRVEVNGQQKDNERRKWIQEKTYSIVKREAFILELENQLGI